MNAFAHDPAEDRRLAAEAQKGDLAALDALVQRHQVWVFHLAHRMLWNRADAEDATQEILIKAVTRLHSFEGRSEFRTWLYRIASNHLLDRCRAARSFDDVARTLVEIPDAEMPDPDTTGVEQPLLVEEAKIACTTGMLLCLEPRQRIAFLIGEVLGVTDDVGAEVLETSPGNFRQILSRARKTLYGFLQRHCGLADEHNRCRCARKTKGFIDRGFITPTRLQFVRERIAPVRTYARSRVDDIQELESRYADIFRDTRMDRGKPSGGSTVRCRTRDGPRRVLHVARPCGPRRLVYAAPRTRSGRSPGRRPPRRKTCRHMRTRV